MRTTSSGAISQKNGVKINRVHFYNHFRWRFFLALVVAHSLFTPVLCDIVRVCFSILALVTVKWTLPAPHSQAVELLSTVSRIGLHLGLMPLRFAGTLAEWFATKLLIPFKARIDSFFFATALTNECFLHKLSLRKERLNKNNYRYLSIIKNKHGLHTFLE